MFSVIHFQIVACFDASPIPPFEKKKKNKYEKTGTEIQHLLLWRPLRADTFLWLWYILMYCFISCCTSHTLSFFFSYSQSHSKCPLIWSFLPLHIYLISPSLFFPLFLPRSRGALSPAPVPPWSFKQIAKEKFSVPLRDNYQTVKLPRSSHWVITFPPSLLCFLFFSSNETISFLKPWQSTIPRRRRPSDFWMKTVSVAHYVAA